MRRKERFYYVTWGSNVTREAHWCVTVDYQQIANGNIANQIHGFTIDYGKFILILLSLQAEISKSIYSNVCLKVKQVSRGNLPWSFDVFAGLPAVFMESQPYFNCGSPLGIEQGNFIPH